MPRSSLSAVMRVSKRATSRLFSACNFVFVEHLIEGAIKIGDGGRWSLIGAKITLVRCGVPPAPLQHLAKFAAFRRADYRMNSDVIP